MLYYLICFYFLLICCTCCTFSGCWLFWLFYDLWWYVRLSLLTCVRFWRCVLVILVGFDLVVCLVLCTYQFNVVLVLGFLYLLFVVLVCLCVGCYYVFCGFAALVVCLSLCFCFAVCFTCLSVVWLWCAVWLRCCVWWVCVSLFVCLFKLVVDLIFPRWFVCFRLLLWFCCFMFVSFLCFSCLIRCLLLLVRCVWIYIVCLLGLGLLCFGFVVVFNWIWLDLLFVVDCFYFCLRIVCD